MGGSGGGSASERTPRIAAAGGSDSGGVRGAPGGDCHQVDFEATVASLAPDLDPPLHVGEILAVVLSGVAPSQRIELRRDEDTIGTIVNQFATLLACIEAGVEFQAEVTRATAPVSVRVAAIPL